MSSGSGPTTKPLLDECPNCGSTDLTPADEINDSLWDDTDTGCQDCTRVFDARGRQKGGFDSDVARELHSAMLDGLKESLGVDDDE